jgi:cytidyltransferase-like protein
MNEISSSSHDMDGASVSSPASASSAGGLAAPGRVLGLDSLSRHCTALRSKGKRIVLCHGVFDLLHVGHIRHLRAAKAFGDILVVTITDDPYVNKGPDRPAFPSELRARCVRDMASGCGSSTTGSNVALCQRRSENQMRHTPLESTTSPIDGCEIGSRTQVISTRHPQRKLYEVHYARCVGIPNGRVPVLPGPLGISTRRTAGAR